MQAFTILGTGLILFSYLVGSVSTAIITCRLMGLPDPRTQGSQNPGATNVLRLGGKKAAAVTLLGDTLKGVIPVLLATGLKQPEIILALVGLAAFLGHLYPIFFGFQGGKGVATAFGVFLALSWVVATALIVTWLVMAKLFKISSIAALTAACLAPLFVWLFDRHLSYVAVSIIISVMLIYRHRSNIQRLLHGDEGKI